MVAFPSYKTGTVSVGEGDTTIVGLGSIWSGVSARPGDDIKIAGHTIDIVDVIDPTHLSIDPWPYDAVPPGTSYKIIQRSPLRYANGQATADVTKLVAALNKEGFYHFVDLDETKPDQSLGDDGQYARKPLTGEEWVKRAGVWVFLGIFKPFGAPEPWSGSVDYGTFEVATQDGSSYVAILPNTNQMPPNATYWRLLASKGDPGETGTNGLPGATGAGYRGTSSTSFLIAAGSKAFTTQAGLAYVAGSRARAASLANPANYMEGIATAYAGTTLTINVTRVGGSGTFADWNLTIAGDPGSGDMLSTNNLAELTDKGAAQTSLGGTTVGKAVFTATDAGAARIAIGILESDRRNVLLGSIYQSKLVAGYRRLLNGFYDGYKSVTDDGINAASSSFYVAGGTGFVLPTAALAANTTSLLHVDGATGSTTITESAIARTWTNHAGALSTAQSKFGGSSYDCGAGAGWVDTPDSTDFTLGGGDFTIEIQFYRNGGNGTRRFIAGQVSNSGATGAWFIELDASNHLSGTVYKAGVQTTVAGSTAITTAGFHHAAFVRTGNNLLLFLDGVQEGSTPAFIGSVDDSPDVLSVGRAGALPSLQWNGWWDEFRFSKGIARWTTTFAPPSAPYVPTPDNMTVVTTAQTADSAVSSARVLIEFDNVAGPTLNTDLTVEVTCNGGANWTNATLSSVSSNGQGARKIVETVDQACTAGTSFAARIKTANNKSVPIYGVSLTVH